MIDATDLAQWAKRRNSQALLPELVRRLILATDERPRGVSFRSGEGVQFCGWDGVVASAVGGPVHPGGSSGWELSNAKSVTENANKNYRKRTKQPLWLNPADATFVFATARRWRGKEAWCSDRKEEGVWRDVVALDADDLHAWLQIAPAVHTWISIETRHRPPSAKDLETVWSEWTLETTPPMSTNLVLAGRDCTRASILEWLRGSECELVVSAETRDVALAAFIAVVMDLPEDERARELARSVLVTDRRAWDQVRSAQKTLTIIPDFEGENLVGGARESGHRIVLPRGRSDGPSASQVSIDAPSREKVQNLLRESGIGRDKAARLANLACRSFPSFRRSLAAGGPYKNPAWANPVSGADILPLILAGGWSMRNDADCEIISRLAGRDHAEINGLVGRWSAEADRPIMKIDGMCSVVCKDEAWSLLHLQADADLLQRFSEACQAVLATPDPRFELPDAERFLANLRGKIHPNSDKLREELADSLALLGSNVDLPEREDDVDPKSAARVTVREILRRAEGDGQLWASLAEHLHLLAEAWPDQVLGAIERELQKETPALIRLYSEKEDILFRRPDLWGIVRALGILSWSPEYLSGASLLLGRLAELDPGEARSSQAMDRLRRTFLPRFPQTRASKEARLEALDAIRQRLPGLAWGLMLDLLPTYGQLGIHAETPRWRNWAEGGAQRPTQAEYWMVIREVVDRLLEDASKEKGRWKGLIEALRSLDEQSVDKVLEALSAQASVEKTDEIRAEVWGSLREAVILHRQYPDANWALPEERILELEALQARWEPTAINERFGWLFDPHPELPLSREAKRKERDDKLRELRAEAIETIFEEGGEAVILDFARNFGDPHGFGVALGRSGKLEREADFLAAYLSGPEDWQRLLALGFVRGRQSTEGAEWTKELATEAPSEFDATQRANLLFCLPCDEATWDLVEEQDPEVGKKYWSLVHPYQIDDQSDPMRACQKLLQAGRPHTAVVYLSSHRDGGVAVSAELVEEVLGAALQTSLEDDPPVGSAYAYRLSNMLDLLESEWGVEDPRVASLEWGFLPVFGTYDRSPRALYAALGRDPGLFVDLIRFAFRGEGEERRELSTEEQERRERARQLLRRWRTIPAYDPNEGVDEVALRQWVHEVRAALAASGHAIVGDGKLGELLSGAPPGEDGAWPHEAVRDLIEELSSDDLERGISIGKFNSRGMVSKSLTEGGEQERTIAKRYDDAAKKAAGRWPRTAAMLRGMRDSYQGDARAEDRERDRREKLEP